MASQRRQKRGARFKHHRVQWGQVGRPRGQLFERSQQDWHSLLGMVTGQQVVLQLATEGGNCVGTIGSVIMLRRGLLMSAEGLRTLGGRQLNLLLVAILHEAYGS